MVVNGVARGSVSGVRAEVESYTIEEIVVLADTESEGGALTLTEMVIRIEAVIRGGMIIEGMIIGTEILTGIKDGDRTIEIVIEIGIDAGMDVTGRWKAIGIGVLIVAIGMIETVAEILIEIEGAVAGIETSVVVVIGVVTKVMRVGIEESEEVVGIGRIVPVGSVRRKREIKRILSMRTRSEGRIEPGRLSRTQSQGTEL